MFTPSVDVKEELKNTSIQITCLDEDGNVLKRVTSTDSGDIEDENGNENENQNENGGGENGGGTNTNPTNPTNGGGEEIPDGD